MAENWLEDHMLQKRGEKEARIRQRKAELAEEGAPRFFSLLVDRVGKDIARYHQQFDGDRSIHMDEVSTRGFKIRKPTFPALTLKVELKSASIEYSYYRKPDDTIDGQWSPIHRFRLISDLDGNIQAMHGDLPFIDASEVSAALLKLVI